MKLSQGWIRPVERLAGVMVLVGLACIVGAAWAVRPALGVGVLGIVLVVLGKGFDSFAASLRATFPVKPATGKQPSSGLVASSARVERQRQHRA